MSRRNRPILRILHHQTPLRRQAQTALSRQKQSRIRLYRKPIRPRKHPLEAIHNPEPLQPATHPATRRRRCHRKSHPVIPAPIQQLLCPRHQPLLRQIRLNLSLATRRLAPPIEALTRQHLQMPSRIPVRIPRPQTRRIRLNRKLLPLPLIKTHPRLKNRPLRIDENTVEIKNNTQSPHHKTRTHPQPHRHTTSLRDAH